MNQVGAGQPAPDQFHHVDASADSERCRPYRDMLLSRFRSVKGRLAALVLVAAIPFVLACGTIAFQNYEFALEVSRDKVVQLKEAARARHADAIDGAQQMLQSLAQDPVIFSDNTVCHQRLASVIALQSVRYSNILAFGADGSVLCRGVPPPQNGDWTSPAHRNDTLLQGTLQNRNFKLGMLRESRRLHRPIIPLAYPVIQNAKLLGFLMAGLRMDWFAADGSNAGPQLRAVWITEKGGPPQQLAEAGAADLPAAATLNTLLASPDDEVIMAQSVGGRPYAYAAASVAGDFRLLVAYPTADDQAAARLVLFARAAELTALLAIGLAAVAYGTHLALVQPLNQLGRAVELWRTGGTFDVNTLRTPPFEVRRLALSFAEATRSLAAQSEALRAAGEKQDLLMREIHHRVKNNLQIVASLLNLQASRIRLPEARAEFASARDRVRALATLHRHLYAEGELSSINMRSFLRELCHQLFDAMGERAGGRIALTIEATELELSSDQAVPLSLIVTEAVSNALKYAFPHGRPGHVAIFLSSAEGMATLVIEDDGVGIPAGRAETETGTRDGLGIQLIRGFARQLGAVLDVHEEQGTTYRVTFPLKRGAAELPDASM